MRRFIKNRWWTFILALVVSVLGVVSSPLTSQARDDSGWIGDGSNGGTVPGTNPDPQGTGDPDSPSSPGAASIKSGDGATSYGRSTGTYGVSGVGDASTSARALVWLKVRIALGVMRSFYLKY
jgi:hypothetical protein